MKTSEVLGWGVLVLIIVALGAYAIFTPNLSGNGIATSTASGQAVTFYCAQGSFAANFNEGAVKIVFPDNRSYTLAQVMSGSGIRYEATTSPGTLESFRSEGSWGELAENGTPVYANCIAAQVSTASGTSTFTDQSNTFSFQFPNTFAVVGTAPGYSTDWSLNATSSGMVLAKLTLPQSAYPKTNFGDANFTVGVSGDPAALSECLTFNPGGNSKTPPTNASIGGLTFVKFAESDAAAGNRYDTTSYRIIRDNMCYALEYTIHYGAIANYPKGTPEFNEAALTNELDQVAQSFTFL